MRKSHAGFAKRGCAFLCTSWLGTGSATASFAQKHADLLASYAFDYVIGSVHVVHTRDPYYPVYFERRDPAEAYTEYYQAVYENLAAFHNFDALGHLDYVFRYGPQDPAQPYDTYTPYAPLIDDILRFLIAHDIALEVNTGAFRCGLFCAKSMPADPKALP